MGPRNRSGSRDAQERCCQPTRYQRLRKELLLDFLDAFHAQLKADLESLYADEWLERGVKSKFTADYFERTRQMLESPMRVVDMEKTDEEIFGVAHLWNIDCPTRSSKTS